MLVHNPVEGRLPSSSSRDRWGRTWFRQPNGSTHVSLTHLVPARPSTLFSQLLGGADRLKSPITRHAQTLDATTYFPSSYPASQLLGRLTIATIPDLSTSAYHQRWVAPMYIARPLPVLSTARPDNQRINLPVASVTPLASVLPSVHSALGHQQAARRPAACAADAPAGYAQRYAHAIPTR